MNATKTHQLIEAYRKLKTAKKELEYRFAAWAHEVRSEFSPGTLGDEKFRGWLSTELGVPPGEQVELLHLARTFKVVSDQATWAAQGADDLRMIVDRPRRDQVRILGAAKVEGKKIRDIIRAEDRAALARNPPDVIPVRPHDRRPVGTGDRTELGRWLQRLPAETLAVELAERIADGLLSAPPDMLAKAKRIAADLRRARAKRAA